MGYFTTFTINILSENNTTAKTKEEITKEITVLAQKGDAESLAKISKLIESKDNTVTENICDKLNEITDYRFALNTDTVICCEDGEIKWYESIEDLLKVSKAFPDTLIQVDGEGEESGDIWRTFYKGGKSQCAKAKVVYEDYDESKLA